jgi:hypothetical protein
MSTSRLVKGHTSMYAATALSIFVCGAFSLGTFPALSIGEVLLTALAVFAAVWAIYCIIGYAVCASFGIKNPGYLLPTVLGVISCSASVSLVGWLFPSVVLASGFVAAMPFALAVTLLSWILAYASGYLSQRLTLLPQR